MNEIDLVNWISNQGFGIAVAVYLLYERSFFNQKVSVTLEKIVTVIERIEKEHQRR